MKKSSTKKDLLKLKSRVDYLEGVNQWYMLATEILTQMSELYVDTTNDRKVDDIFGLSINHIRKLYDFDHVIFYIVNEDSEFTLSSVYPEQDVSHINSLTQHLIDSGEFAWAINNNKALTYHVHDKVLLLHVLSSKSGIQGMFVGIKDDNDKEVEMSQGALNLLSVILYNTACAIDNAKLYNAVNSYNSRLKDIVEKRTQELEFQYRHDDLTGLPNRILFLDRLQQCIDRAERSKEVIAVVVADIDMFKVVNDSLGHEAGDLLIQQVGERMQNLLRGTDTVARIKKIASITLSRFGGDEFTLMIPSAKSTDDILTVIHRIMQCLSEPFIVADEKIFLTLSLGISLYPHDAIDASALLKQADSAMYYAKEMGRNNYQFFSESIQQQSMQYLSLGSQLHHALDKNEFVLCYQPQVSLKTGKVVGMEALIRWQKSDGTVVPPDQFIPVAEETGMIIDIGNWVMEEAFTTAAKLSELGFDDLIVSINLSAKQFIDANLAAKIDSLLKKYRVEGNRIEFEITEGTIMKDRELAVQHLHALHQLGLTLAVDDFGTGYSSLNYLKKFPLDALKIDKSFIDESTSQNEDAAIVKAIIALAHSLELKVIAEGVETQDQVMFLKGLDCELVQGYYFSEPLVIDDCIKFLHENNV